VSDHFVIFDGSIHVFAVKEPNKTARKMGAVFKMIHFTSQNGLFCSPKRLILLSKTGRFRV